MSASNVGLARIAAMAVLIAIVAVEVSQAIVPNYVRSRCDGRADEVEDVEISSCPTGGESGACAIKLNSSPEVKLAFTPLKDHDEPIEFTVERVNNGPDYIPEKVSYNPCEYGARCPLKGGRTEKIDLKIKDLFKHRGAGQYTFNVHSAKSSSSHSIYCVNFFVEVF